MRKKSFILFALLLAVNFSHSTLVYAETIETSGAVTETVSPTVVEPKRNFQNIVANLKEDSKQVPDHSPSNVLQGLALCLGVFFIGVFFLKRFNKSVGSTSQRRLRLLERLPLGQKSALFLVELDGKTLVVGSGSEAVSIHTLQHSQGTPIIQARTANHISNDFDNEIERAASGVAQ